MRIHFYSLFLITTLTLFFFSKSFAEEPSRVNEFLHQQRVIRVDGVGGGGYGNLASTIRVMNQLRNLGFNGTFEVIYSISDIPQIMTLFGLTQEELDKGEKNNIRFIPLKNYFESVHQGSIEKVTLGISGPEFDPRCYEAEYSSYTMTDDLFCKNTANFFNVDVFIGITNDLNQDKYTVNTYFINQILNTYASDEENSYLLGDLVTLNDVSQYLSTDPQGKDLASKKPAIETLIHGIEAKSFNVLPVYGWTLHINSSVYSTDPEKYYLSHILQIIMGARYAQLHNPELSKKGLVIPVFYNYETESLRITEMLHSHDWNMLDMADSNEAMQASNNMDLPNVFSTASLSDPNTSQVLQQLQPGHILLLSMGPLPKIVFDGLYTGVNQDYWPQVREGLDTLNQLVLTGKPHFRCGESGAWELGLDRIPYPTLKQELHEFYSNFCNYYKTPQWEYITLGNLIIDAQNPDSEFSKYFADIKMDTLKPENNRVNHAIEIAMQLLKNDLSKVEEMEPSQYYH